MPRDEMVWVPSNEMIHKRVDRYLRRRVVPVLGVLGAAVLLTILGAILHAMFILPKQVAGDVKAQVVTDQLERTEALIRQSGELQAQLRMVEDLVNYMNPERLRETRDYLVEVERLRRDHPDVTTLSSIIQMTPPIGSVLPFWGSRTEVLALDGWELCNGDPIADKRSPLLGRPKPDMSQRFIMGVTDADNTWSPVIEGGSNRIEERNQGNGGRTAGHALSVAEMPAHSHPHKHYVARTGDSGRYLGDRQNHQSTIATHGESGQDSKYSLTTIDGTAHAGVTNIDRTEAGGGRSHSHALPPIPWHDNRPQFVGMYYIIRVR